MRPIAVKKQFGEHVFIPAGCIHWPLSEKHLVDAWIEKIKETKNAFTLLCGDTFDFSRGHFRKHNKSYTEDETSILALDEWHKKDIVELAKKLEPIKGKILGTILGNHYHHFSDGTTSEQFLCQLLKIPFLGTTGMIRVDFHNTSKRLHSLVIYAHHGTGGGVTIGGDANNLERKEAGFDADIYVMSHTHRRHAFKTEQLQLSKKGTPTLRTRPRVFVRTGTFLKGYAQDNPMAERAYQAPYAEKMGLRPTSLGYVEVLIGMTHISRREKDITAQRLHRQEIRTRLDVKF
jgi:hypothetical protein